MNLALSLEEHIRKDYKLFNYKFIGQAEFSIISLNPDLFLKNYG